MARTVSQNAVETGVQAFREHPRLFFALAPEGTRKRSRWRTGFYHLARGADVPIVLITFDFGRHVIGIGPTLTPSGDLEGDIAELQRHVRPEMARHPAQYAPD